MKVIKKFFFCPFNLLPLRSKVVQ